MRNIKAIAAYIHDLMTNDNEDIDMSVIAQDSLAYMAITNEEYKANPNLERFDAADDLGAFWENINNMAINLAKIEHALYAHIHNEWVPGEVEKDPTDNDDDWMVHELHHN